MDPQPSGVHPVRLVVVFHGGNPKSRGLGGTALVWPDNLPSSPRPGGGHHLGGIGLAARLHHQTEIVNAPPSRVALYGQGGTREYRFMVAGNRRTVGHLPEGLAGGRRRAVTDHVYSHCRGGRQTPQPCLYIGPSPVPLGRNVAGLEVPASQKPVQKPPDQSSCGTLSLLVQQ